LSRARRAAQFNQNYFPGSFSTNINNNPAVLAPSYGFIGYGRRRRDTRRPLASKPNDTHFYQKLKILIKRSAQFNQNYLPGSFSTNINNVGHVPGAFLGQQNYLAGSHATNFAGGYGKKKRSAQFNQNYQPGSFSTNVNNVGYAPGAFLGQQNYNAGSFATNFAGGYGK
jgi:hypothetical protein